LSEKGVFDMRGLLEQIQVNVPFAMLHEKYLSGFIKSGLNPEIGLDAAALERFSLEDFAKVAERLMNVVSALLCMHLLWTFLRGLLIRLSRRQPGIGLNRCCSCYQYSNPKRSCVMPGMNGSDTCT